jgi:hypothetical protein
VGFVGDSPPFGAVAAVTLRMIASFGAQVLFPGDYERYELDWRNTTTATTVTIIAKNTTAVRAKCWRARMILTSLSATVRLVPWLRFNGSITKPGARNSSLSSAQQLASVERDFDLGAGTDSMRLLLRCAFASERRYGQQYN